MQDDEDAIRAAVKAWMDATKAGDAETVLALMADDAVFMVAGQEPFGKDTFAALSRSNDADMAIDGTNEILELQVMGNWAFTRNKIAISVTMGDSAPISRSGYALTLFRKDDGKWRLVRDANLVTPD